MYYNNALKAVNIALRFPSFENGDGIQMLVASMPYYQALREWELHTLVVIKWNDNHKPPIKYCSQDIIERMEWLMWHPANAEHHIYTPQHFFNSDTALKCIYTDRHTTDLW